MQNYCKTIGALAAASALVAGNASAEVEYEIHAGYSSEYLWRGIDLGQDLVEMGADAAYTMDKLSLSGGVWAAAFDSSATTGNDTDNEVDLYTEAAYDFGFMTGAVGYIYYWNVASLGTDNQEVYFQVSRDFGWATLSYTYFWDMVENQVGVNAKGQKISDGNNGYSELALSRSFELSPCLSLNLSTNLAVFMESFECGSWTTKASLDWGFVENAKLSPFVTFAVALSEEPRTAWDATENEFVAGSMLSVSF